MLTNLPESIRTDIPSLCHKPGCSYVYKLFCALLMCVLAYSTLPIRTVVCTNITNLVGIFNTEGIRVTISN